MVIPYLWSWVHRTNKGWYRGKTNLSSLIRERGFCLSKDIITIIERRERPIRIEKL